MPPTLKLHRIVFTGPPLSPTCGTDVSPTVRSTGTTAAAVMQTTSDHLRVGEVDNALGDVAQAATEKSAAVAASGAINFFRTKTPAWPSKGPTAVAPATARAAKNCNTDST